MDTLYTIVLILVGTLVTYYVTNSLTSQMTNVTGLWATVRDMAPIIAPIVFLIAMVQILRARG